MAKQQEENGVAEEKVYTIRLINKIFLGFIIALFIFTIAGAAKPNPQYDEFKTSIDNVMELNKPIVFKHKTTKNNVTIYLNSVLWDEMSASERVNKQQRLKVVVQPVGQKTRYISENEEITVIFK